MKCNSDKNLSLVKCVYVVFFPYHYKLLESCNLCKNTLNPEGKNEKEECYYQCVTMCLVQNCYSILPFASLPNLDNKFIKHPGMTEFVHMVKTCLNK